MSKILFEICELCGPVDVKLCEEYTTAVDAIVSNHGDSDIGHRLQAELEARYSFKMVLCRNYAYHEAHGYDYLVE